MGKNPSFRCSDEFEENIELATEALDFDNKSVLIRSSIRGTIVQEAGEIVDHHDDVDRLTWASSEEAK